MADSIPKQVLQQLQNVASETVEKSVKEAGNIGATIISGKELLGLTPMTAGEYQQKQQEDETKKQKEINNIMGRNVGQEIENVIDEKEQKAKEEEQAMLDNIKRQREAEAMEQASMMQAPGNAKRNAAKHQGLPGKKKSQQPDPSQMSQTSEFKGKID
jgi:antitoxin component of MazEF toxin-antitoxin module